MIAAPLVFAAVEPEEAVGLLIVLGTEVNLLTLATEGRRPRPVVRECAVDPRRRAARRGRRRRRAARARRGRVQVAVSVGVVATLARTPPRRRAATARLGGRCAGFIAGGLSTSTTTAGPAVLVYLLGRELTPAQLRDR